VVNREHAEVQGVRGVQGAQVSLGGGAFEGGARADVDLRGGEKGASTRDK